MKRLLEDKRFASAKQYFLFVNLEEMKMNGFDGWVLFDGEEVALV